MFGNKGAGDNAKRGKSMEKKMDFMALKQFSSEVKAMIMLDRDSVIIILKHSPLAGGNIWNTLKSVNE